MQISTPTRARRVAQLSPSASTLRLRATRWALANGHRLDFDALSVILAAKAEVGVPIERWTEDDVWRLWWIDLSGWCARRGLATPDGLAATMLTLFSFLSSTGELAPGSDSITYLEEAMGSAGALGRDSASLSAG